MSKYATRIKLTRSKVSVTGGLQTNEVISEHSNGSC